MKQLTEKNWFARNWKWLVPVGCLGTFLLFAGFVLVIVFLAFGLIKSSDAYKEAVARARADASVQAAIGTPIEEGLFASGNIKTNNASGAAELAIPISGPRGEATVYVVAGKSAGQWTFSTLVVEIASTRKRIDLLMPNATPGETGDTE